MPMIVIKLASYLLAILLIPLMVVGTLVFWCAVAIAWMCAVIKSIVKTAGGD